MSPPASSMPSRNCDVGEPCRRLPVVRFSTVAALISTRTSSPSLTSACTPVASSSGRPIS